MAYIDYEYYSNLYGDKAVEETVFNRLLWDAERKIDIATTGVDNVRKLAVAFPINDYDAESVKRCICKMVYTLYAVEQAQEKANNASGYSETANGLQGKVIKSVSAGNESITFESASNTATLIEKALSDKNIKEQLFKDVIAEYLPNVADANGVNLLYMGPYPYAL